MDIFLDREPSADVGTDPPRVELLRLSKSLLSPSTPSSRAPAGSVPSLPSSFCARFLSNSSFTSSASLCSRASRRSRLSSSSSLRSPSSSAPSSRLRLLRLEVLYDIRPPLILSEKSTPRASTWAREKWDLASSGCSPWRSISGSSSSYAGDGERTVVDVCRF